MYENSEKYQLGERGEIPSFQGMTVSLSHPLNQNNNEDIQQIAHDKLSIGTQNKPPTHTQEDSADSISREFDYTYVKTIARIATYDDLRSAPRVTEIQPAPTTDYIENLASKIYEQAKIAGGEIPYTVIREVTENFIHAQFSEIIVSILDKGNTIRFADQGPGIVQKEKAQLPGFTSAIEPMKKYIRGVGSGLPIVKEYLSLSHGSISIEDNLGTGAVVTVSLCKDLEEKNTQQGNGGWSRKKSSVPSTLIPPLSQREKDFLHFFESEGALGVTDIVNLTDIANSSVYTTLGKLEQAGLIEKVAGKKRILTDFGWRVVESL